MMTFLAQSSLFNSFAVAIAMSIAGAVLSVIVVLRHWAFVGEGIGHSSVGGAGTAWMLALLFPSFDQPWVPYAAVVIFCLLTAWAIGWMIRNSDVNADAAIGIFLVASLAWGFLAQQVYVQGGRRGIPTGWETLIFGQMRDISPHYAYGAIALCCAVLLVVGLLQKEILSYCFDPMMAEVSGVPARFVHYLLMTLLAVTIIIGSRIAGGVLVTALLVLPGASAMQLSRRLKSVMGLSILTGIVGAVGGLCLNLQWPILPVGPSIVLVLFACFLGSFCVVRVRGG